MLDVAHNDRYPGYRQENAMAVTAIHPGAIALKN